MNPFTPLKLNNKFFNAMRTIIFEKIISKTFCLRWPGI